MNYVATYIMAIAVFVTEIMIGYTITTTITSTNETVPTVNIIRRHKLT